MEVFFWEMALYSDLPVYKSKYNLLLAIFRFTKDFGKEYKYTLGEILKKETIEKELTKRYQHLHTSRGF